LNTLKVLNPYGAYCNDELIEARDYIESITEYDYYEANYDGTTLAQGYKKLMGLEDVEGLTVSVPTTQTLSNIALKHQPSWQLFKTKTYSPDYPDAYQAQFLPLGHLIIKLQVIFRDIFHFMTEKRMPEEIT